MFYRFIKLARNQDESNFSGWAEAYDEVIIDTSQKLGAFYHKTIPSLIAWADDRNIKWSVAEKREPAPARS